MALPTWYKWIVLAATSVSTFASYGYITGSSSIATVFYIQIYNERIISGIVGPVQMSMHKISCLPAFYVNRKLGSRWLQVIGGFILSGGTALTAVTSSSWQALLLSGVVSGSGSGMLHVATTSIIKEYFPGEQIGPFGAACLSLNLATIVVPQLWRYLMSALTWQLALITIGAMLITNTLAGLTYVKPDQRLEEFTSKQRRKLSLFVRSSSSSMYTVPERFDRDKSMTKTNLDVLLSDSEDAELEELSEEDEKHSTSDQPTSDERLEEDDDGMVKTLKMPESIALLLVSGLYAGGIISCFTVMGDYAERTLGLTNEQIANALSIQGITQIVSAVIYLLLTACTEFSAVLLQTVSILALAISIMTLTFIQTEAHFCVIVGVIGFFKAITTGNAVPLTLELSNPKRMMRLYVVKCLIDGMGVAGMPFFAVYIQETTNNKAALYLASAALFTSACIFIPFLQRFLKKPRQKQKSEVTKDSIEVVSFICD